jgi:hypothetical protein
MGNRFLLAVAVAGLSAGAGYGQDFIRNAFGLGKKSPPKSEPAVLRGADDAVVPSEYLLTPKNGPYHILVASYVGDQGVKYALQLAKELRTKLGFEAYVHNHREKEPFYRPDAKELESMRKKFDGKAPRFPQLKTPIQDNWVVVVGNFESIDEDRAFDAAMRKLKRLTRDSFSPEVMAELRWGTPANGKNPNELIGLRGAANPLRPREEKLDLKMLKMLKEMNADEPFSIYNNRAPFTLCVYNFNAGAGIVKEKKKGFFGGGQKQSNALTTAGENACILCKLLRDMGEEAYVFHSDTASIVCVNGYEGRNDPRWVKDYEKYSKMKLANGQIELKPSLIPTARDPSSVLMNANAN